MPKFASNQSKQFFFKPAGNPYFASAMMFAQAAAPTGWVRKAWHDDATLRITSGKGNIAVNTVSVSTAMTDSYVKMTGGGTATVAVAPYILTAPQICTHQHAPYLISTIYTSGWAGPGGSAGYGRWWNSPGPTVTQGKLPLAPSNGGAAHTHPDGQVIFSLESTARPMAVKYIDSIIASYTG